MNYICHLFAFKKEILEKTGTFRKEFDGAQDYDLFCGAARMQRIFIIFQKYYIIGGAT